MHGNKTKIFEDSRLNKRLNHYPQATAAHVESLSLFLSLNKYIFFKKSFIYHLFLMELLIKSVFSFGLKSSSIDKIKENHCCCCCKETLDFYGALCSLSQTHHVGSACSYNAYMWEDAASAFAFVF